MIRTKTILSGVFLIAAFSSCIDFFHPDLGDGANNKLVVDGLITDQEGYQVVSVSINSKLANPKFNPSSFCKVTILDNNNNIYILNEYESGRYRVWMDKEDLKPGNSYQVKVQTASGIEVISDFEKMSECPEIDSIYYILKEKPTTNPYYKIQGIQFYVDINGENTNSRYFRWNLTETWEHHAPVPTSNSLTTCWTTLDLKNIYAVTTENLTQNRFRKYALHFVDNQTQRLNYCYSLLINQFSITEPAFRYWDNLRFNSNAQGGLYNTQPLHVRGNLKCTTNPDLEILGFFSVASVKTKRIFVRNVIGLQLLEPICIPDILPNGVVVIGASCTECDYWDGTTFKPDYWPY